MTEPFAVLFDLDGTLLDLPVQIEPVRAELRRDFAERGYQSDFRPILAEIDRGTDALVSDQAERVAMKAAARRKIEMAEIAAADSARLRPGVIGLVDGLLAARVPCGIVTDNSRTCVAPALHAVGLQALEGALRVCIGRDDVSYAKPDPEGVLAAAKALLPSGGVLWMVGDSERDMQAASAARPHLSGIEIRALGVLGGRSSAEELDRAGAETVFEDADRLRSVLL